MERIADKLRIAGGFCAAEAALLLPDETASVMNRLQRDYADHDVLIVPFFISEGYFTRTVIPQRFAAYRYRYNGQTLLPHAGVSAWISEQVREALSRVRSESKKARGALAANWNRLRLCAIMKIVMLRFHYG